MSLLSKLISQAKKPSGILGKAMVLIMNIAHRNKTIWGLSQVHIQENNEVLDIGCGGGITLNLLQSWVTTGNIVGIDYSKDAVNLSIKTNQNAINDGLVRVELGNVMCLPYANDSFDIVTAVQTHYFWPDMLQSVMEVYRILRNDGKVVFIAESYKMSYHMPKYETIEKLKSLLEENGFRHISIQENNGWVCLAGTK